jgi:putative CocE/NonD family hydrolase
VGGVPFGEASLIDIDRLHLDWYDWTLRDGHRPAFLRDHVTYYVEGLDEWRYAPSLDRLGTSTQRLYFRSDGVANDSAADGRLDDAAGPSSARSYTYDPNDTRPGEHEAAYGPKYLLDDSALRNLFGGGLVYDSSPLGPDRVVVGRMRAVLWLSMDVPDTDIEVTLYELRPDGTTIRLAQDVMRARYRESLREAHPVPSGRVLEYQFSGFPFFARAFAPDSRLRVLIRAPNSIYVQKNYNSGGDVSQESGAVARVAHVTLSEGGEQHASFIELPFARRDAEPAHAKAENRSR